MFISEQRSLCLLTAILFSFAALPPYVAYATEDIKVEHYESKEFSNVEDAMVGLVSTSNEMATIAANNDLDVTMMEKIHQISYTTENAVAKLKSESNYDPTPLAEALEEVHLASENHKPLELKNKFIAYQAELNNFLASQ